MRADRCQRALGGGARDGSGRERREGLGEKGAINGQLSGEEARGEGGETKLCGVKLPVGKL